MVKKKNGRYDGNNVKY